MSDDPLVPVGPTLFQRSQLDAAVKDMIPQLPEGRTHGVGFAANTNGARFAVLFGDRDGHWHAVGAVQIDKRGKISGAVAGDITW